MATDGPVDHACTCPSLRATVTPTLALPSMRRRLPAVKEAGDH